MKKEIIERKVFGNGRVEIWASIEHYDSIGKFIGGYGINKASVEDAEEWFRWQRQLESSNTIVEESVIKERILSEK